MLQRLSKFEKFLIGGIVVGASFLMVTLAAPGLVSMVGGPPPAATEGGAGATAPPVVAEAAPVAAPVATPESLVPPLPKNAASVPDGDLEKLSLLVDLAESPSQSPNIERWKQVLPIAQNLMNGPCDCTQRIWLTRFVAMGNSALSGSSADYKQSAQLIVTMGRNDAQAMALSRSRAH